MNQLIKITDKNGEKAVSAKELFLFLSIGNENHFTAWKKRNIDDVFEQGFDYQILSHHGRKSKGRPTTDYALTLDCAKEVAMMSRCVKGRQARKYFIEVEKSFKKGLHDGFGTIIHIAPTIPMRVIPSEKHVFLVTTKELARAVNVATGTIRGVKHRHKANLVENVHYIDNYRLPDDIETTVWTKNGVIEQARYIRSGHDVKLRDWAEEQIMNMSKLKQTQQQSTVRRHNRLTSDRLLSIMQDVVMIKDETLRLSISNKLNMC